MFPTVQPRLHIILAALVLAFSVPGCSGSSALSAGEHAQESPGFSMRFEHKKHRLVIVRAGTRALFVIAGLPAAGKANLLGSVRSVHHLAAGGLRLQGRSSWATFSITIRLPKSDVAIFHWTVGVKPYSSPPSPPGSPEIGLAGARAANLHPYAPAPPVAGTSVMVSSGAMNTTGLYLQNYTALGSFFNRTNSGADQAAFSYPNAGTKGSLVGADTQGHFGFVLPVGALEALPLHTSTVVSDAYLALIPGVPTDEASTSDTYLRLLGDIYGALPAQNLPAAQWGPLATQAAADLLTADSVVTVDGQRYLRSYVSDTRTSPELITQAAVLAAVKAYEASAHVTLPVDAVLEATLPHFYDPVYQTVMNGLGHDPTAQGESWYYVQNMISLLQLAQAGSGQAKRLLLESVNSLETLAHDNRYEFPLTFRYGQWTAKDAGTQADVAGGYAWLMLGLHDLTGDSSYLDEAKAAILHIAGKGFNLSYETQMTAYGADAAERLYVLTNDAAYREEAHLALANLFHATRLWDCTYGLCRSGHGYHTLFGLNPLPWSDYVAMLEQSQAWLALREFLHDQHGEPAYVTDLVNAFVQVTPRSMRYALPTQLPRRALATHPGEYSFVPRNDVSLDIPLEDLRVGESQSGVIGQEIYGAGGPFLFAAYPAATATSR